MTSRNLFLTAALLAAAGAMATPLTPGQAVARLKREMPQRAREIESHDISPVYTAKADDGMPAAYIFNLPGDGYTILGADDIAYAVLGYSDSGSVIPSSMPESMRWWLSEYSAQIEYARRHGIDTPSYAPAYEAGREAIMPLLTTIWNQDAPYNNMCPTAKNGAVCPSGCVATSMAQVMNYHKYPEIGEGLKQYNCSSIGRKLTLNFSRTPFDWDHMLDYYAGGNYSQEEADAVAYLMKACGYSVEMQYSADSSGTQGFTIAPALKEYFKYDVNTRSLFRMPFSSSQWSQMIYDNLHDIGPVIINGQAPLTGGHSFVCDGYDGKGYFHINWGWGGISDGYFAIDALDPEAQGIGGAEGGFNFMQNAIFGIQPPKGDQTPTYQKVLFQFGSSTATLDGRKINFSVKDWSPLGWGNYDFEEITVNVGVIIQPESDPSSQTVVQGLMGTRDEIYLSQGTYYPETTYTPNMMLPDLADGIYRLTLASHSVEEAETPWLPVSTPWGMVNYVVLHVENGQYRVSDVTPARMSISDVELLSPVYSYKNALISAKFTNGSDLELLQGLSPRLFDATGKLKYYGSSMLIAIDPSSTMEKKLVVKFFNSDGTAAKVTTATDLTMKFFDPQTAQYYPDVEIPVTFLPYPGATTLQLFGFTMDNSTKGETEIDGRKYYGIRFVEDPSSITGSITVKCTKGFFDGMVMISIEKADLSTAYGRLPVISGVMSEYAFIPAGQTMEIPYDIDFSQAEMNVGYYLVIQYTNGGTVNQLDAAPFCLQGSAVETLQSETAATEYFNLQGQRITSPAPGQPVIVKRGAKTEKVIF